MRDDVLKNNLLVELHVPSFVPVKDFYGKLGFEIAVEDPTGEHLGYLIMRRNDGAGPTALAFYGNDERVYDQQYFKQFPRSTPRGYCVEIVVPVADCAAVYASVAGTCEAYIEAPLKEKTDGVRVWQDFRLRDPFGFYVRFVSGLSWSEFTV